MRPAPDDEVEGQPEREPDRARVAGRRVRHHRNDPERHRERRADQRRGERCPEGPRQVRLGEAEPDHGELRRREGEQDAERVEAGEELDVVSEQAGGDHEPDRDRRHGDDRLRRDERAAVEPPEAGRELAVAAERVRQPSEAGHRRRRRREQDERTGESDIDDERVADEVWDVSPQCLDDAREWRPQPLLAERRLAVLNRERGETDGRDCGRDHDDEPDRREEAPRQRPARLAGLLGEVGDRLEARVGEHRQRQGEGEVVPGRRHPEVGALRERIRGEEQCEAENHEQQLGRQVEPGDDDPGGMELRAARERTAAIARITVTAMTMSQGDSRSSSMPSAVPR